MPKGAGSLRSRVGFFKRPGATDDYGNEETNFSGTPEFTLWAEIIPKLGGETVLASRITGTTTATITVRQSEMSRQINSAWMAKDMQLGTIWNIRSGPIDPDQRGAWHEFLGQTGVAP